MRARSQNWFLLLLALALAVAPLRGAWTMPVSAGDESTPHCAQMDMPGTGMPTGMQQHDDAGETTHACEQGCGGDCCDGACNVCSHGTTTLADTVISTQQKHPVPTDRMFLVSFPERTLIPPLRPPAFLP